MPTELQLYLGGDEPAADTVEVKRYMPDLFTSGIPFLRCERRGVVASRHLESVWQASAQILVSKGHFHHFGGTEKARVSTSGRTGHVEYCRTFGALTATLERVAW